MPLEENPYIVPHLKALISGEKFRDEQRCGSTLSLWNAFLKISILLHKMASGYKVLSFAVCIEIYTTIQNLMQMLIFVCHLMKQKADIQEGMSQA